MPPLDLNNLRAFVDVVERGGVRDAARASGVPKSTLSRRLATLETQLGTRLINRTTRRLRLTEGGRLLFERCAPALAAVGEAAAAVDELQREPRGLLRVSAPPTFGQLFLGELAAEFLERYADVRLAIDLSDRHVDVVAEGYDVALRSGAALADSSLVRRDLGATGVRCLASPRYLEARGEPRTPRDLERHECLLYGSADPSGGQTWAFEAGGRVRHVRVRGRFAANSLPALVDAAARGLGVVRTLAFLARHEIAQGRLVAVLEAFPCAPNRLTALYPAAKRPSAKLRALLEFLAQRLSTPPWAAPALDGPQASPAPPARRAAPLPAEQRPVGRAKAPRAARAGGRPAPSR
ncbi:MAG TPA: LysR family transcriptional regulator [Polyangiaceae bacterium]|nr:LysR family transcriptional regulator [Polyangiaceae bacterium]